MEPIKKHYQITQLVESYYDIQKTRMENYNRIVAWIKENEEVTRKLIKQQLPGNGKEEEEKEVKTKEEDKIIDEELEETEKEEEEQEISFDESLEKAKDEARKLLEETPRSTFLKLLDSKKYSIVAKAVCEGKLKISELDNMVWFYNKMRETEKELGTRLDLWSEDINIRKAFLINVKGIGGVFSSGLIAWIGPIERFNNVAKLWSYCGLSPHSIRRKGEKTNYNVRLKSFTWKIWNSFIKYNCEGRRLYLQYKNYAEKTHPDWSKGHRHNWAGRKTVKIFLACLWQKWREIEELPTPIPYPVAYLGHSELDIIKPEQWMEKVYTKKKV